jgi:phage shock protein A
MQAGGPRRSALDPTSNAALLERVQTLRAILPGMAEEVAIARREAARLRRENERLERRVHELEARQPAASS